ncbi:MAG: tetratricopeptide repeat protein, partial [Terriglobales bacterium]
MVSWVILVMLSWSDGPARLLDGLDHAAPIPPVVSRPDRPFGPPVTVRRASSPRTLEGDELLKIGDLHDVQNHLQEALPYYQRALAAFRAKKNRRGEAAALARIGSVHERRGSHAEALAALEAAVPILATVGEDGPHAHALLKLGRILESLGRMAEAQEAYHHARTLFQRSHDRKGYTESLIRLGSLWTAQDRVAEALPILQTALKDSHDRRDQAQQMAALTVTGDARVRAGEPGMA